MIIIMKAYSPSILRKPQYTEREIKRERESCEQSCFPRKSLYRSLIPSNSGYYIRCYMIDISFCSYHIVSEVDPN